MVWQIARIFFTGDSGLMAPAGVIDTPEALPVFWDQQEKCSAEGGFRFEQPKIERNEAGEVREIVFVYGRPSLPVPTEYTAYELDFGGEPIYPQSVDILDNTGDCWVARLEFLPMQGAVGKLTVWGVVTLDNTTNSQTINFPSR